MKITFLFHCFVVLHFQCIHHFFSLQVVVASNSINKSDWTSKEIQTSPLRPNQSDQRKMRGRNSIFLGSNCLETWTKNLTIFKSTNLLLKTHFLCCKVIFLFIDVENWASLRQHLTGQDDRFRLGNAASIFFTMICLSAYNYINTKHNRWHKLRIHLYNTTQCVCVCE